MTNTKIFRLEIDNPATKIIVDYPCSQWEVSCILVPASTSKIFVEFKRYENDGKQTIESHYVTNFKIIELCKTKNQNLLNVGLLQWMKTNLKKLRVKAGNLFHRIVSTWQK